MSCKQAWCHDAAEADEPLTCVIVRNTQKPFVVTLPVDGVEVPEPVSWVDLHHPRR